MTSFLSALVRKISRVMGAFGLMPILLTARGAKLFEFFRGVAFLGFDEGIKAKKTAERPSGKKRIKTIL